VEMIAMADIFQDRLDSSLARMKKALPDKVKVTPETVFSASTLIRRSWR